jgi:hypothetical protein
MGNALFVSCNIMKKKIHLLSLILVVVFFSCGQQGTLKRQNQLKIDTSSKEKIDTVKSNLLFAFVGQKISVDELPYREGSMDRGFKAKYKIIQRVFGNFSKDTIEFVAWDHLGIPAFSEFDNVLLYVSADSGIYYHQKYMYNDVYLTTDGRWAGTYAKADYEHEYNKYTKIKPIKIDFANIVSYPIGDKKAAMEYYPKPYYNIVDNKAIAVYGNYVDELFILKRDGYLTAREIFKDGKLNE